LFSSFWANAGSPTKIMATIAEKILFIAVLLFAVTSSFIPGISNSSGSPPVDAPF
jgi:hypothetical protein